MHRRVRPVLGALVVLLGLAAAGPGVRAQSADARAEADAVARGEYVFRASGGCSCHTDTEHDGAFLAGGRALETPFGTYYSTNITPHPEHGIGGWSEADFIRAMTEGVAPDGSHYFPVFPYTSFSGMREADLRDLKAYLDTVEPVARANEPHDAIPPFNLRVTMPLWKALNFEPAPFEPDPERSEEWNRGAYLVSAVAHCGECHTPRDLMGGLRRRMHLAGSEDGPEGALAPNITPHEATGIGGWSAADLTWLLQTGFLPDGDDVQGIMGEVIDQGYSHLRAEDLDAIATYLRSVAPIENRVE